MKPSLIYSTYKVTSDMDWHIARYGITRELADQFEELHARSMDKKDKNIIERLTNLIIQYPNAPELKNFLSTAYNTRGNRKKATEINQWTVAEHPDYLFGKLNLAISCIEKKEFHKVPEILGELMEIKQLYPDREEFHISEITGFYKVAVLYFCDIKNMELAENRYEILADLAPEHPDTIDAETFLYALRFVMAKERKEKYQREGKTVIPLFPVPVSIKTEDPVFTHFDIYELYNYGTDIPRKIIEKILSLPSDTVMDDLEKVLADAVDRYNYYLDEHGYEAFQNFPLHAICLLGELKAEKSLPAVLHFLSQHEDVLHFWLGDHLTETMWKPLYKLALNQAELLKNFCITPGVYSFAKTVASETLAQIALHHPERRNEISGIYKEILVAFDNAKIKDNLLDSEFLGLFIGDILDCGFKELLPEIKSLYTKGHVSYEASGPIEEVIDILNQPPDPLYKREIVSIYDLYENIEKNWVQASDDWEDEWDDWELGSPEEKKSPITVIKTGRNDPCPCGSGKKFKKCCIDKFK